MTIRPNSKVLESFPSPINSVFSKHISHFRRVERTCRSYVAQFWYWYNLIYIIISEKASLLSRLFRRSGRSKQRQIGTFSAQFPPAEWFNSKAVHLHSVGTQTSDLVCCLIIFMKTFFITCQRSNLRFSGCSQFNKTPRVNDLWLFRIKTWVINASTTTPSPHV